MKTLFLDYDGVLHPDTVYLVNGEPELRAEPGLSLFCWASNLIEVLGDVEVDIVLATTWKDQLGFEGAAGYLPDDLRRRRWSHCQPYQVSAHEPVSRHQELRERAKDPGLDRAR